MGCRIWRMFWSPRGDDLSGWQMLEAANDISPDGRYIVGRGINTAGDAEAFLAVLGPSSNSVGCITSLGLLPASDVSDGEGVSADGSIVVGDSSMSSTSVLESFLWTSGSGMTGLGFLGTDTSSEATAVSADGSVIVGASNAGWTKRFDGLNPVDCRALVLSEVESRVELRMFRATGP